jgi:hypothetical protein
MAKENPWMPATRLRSLAQAGQTYDEIATLNEQATGYRPNRSVVGRKLTRLGVPPRNISHADLLPWEVRPEHRTARLRYMLGAESRARAGRLLSDTDVKARDLLRDLLTGRGAPLVVGYHPDVGFYLAERQASDADIIRAPDTMSAPDDTSPGESDGATKVRFASP